MDPVTTTPPHPVDFIPSGAMKLPQFKDVGYLRDMQQGKSPFVAPPNRVDSMLQARDTMSPWMKTLSRWGGAYLGLPTIDIPALARPRAATGTSSSPSQFTALRGLGQGQAVQPSSINLAQLLGLGRDALPNIDIPFDVAREMPFAYQL